MSHLILSPVLILLALPFGANSLFTALFAGLLVWCEDQ